MYGRILYNNIKEYTPKWFPTIPYSQTVKPTFRRGQQVVSAFNASPVVKSGWRTFSYFVQGNSWAWQVFVFGLTFTFFHLIYQPFLMIYRANNSHRTYEAAMVKEKAHKKKLKDAQQAEENQ